MSSIYCLLKDGHTSFWYVISYLAGVRVRFVRDLYNDCICRIIISSYRLRKVLPLPETEVSMQVYIWFSLLMSFACCRLFLWIRSFFLLNFFWFDIGYIFRCIIALYAHTKTKQAEETIFLTPFLLFWFLFRSFLFFWLWLNPSNDISFFNLHLSCRAPLDLSILFLPHSVERSAPWSVNNSNKFILCLCIIVHGKQQSLNVIPKWRELKIISAQGKSTKFICLLPSNA